MHGRQSHVVDQAENDLEDDEGATGGHQHGQIDVHAGIETNQEPGAGYAQDITHQKVRQAVAWVSPAFLEANTCGQADSPVSQEVAGA